MSSVFWNNCRWLVKTTQEAITMYNLAILKITGLAMVILAVL